MIDSGISGADPGTGLSLVNLGKRAFGEMPKTLSPEGKSRRVPTTPRNTRDGSLVRRQTRESEQEAQDLRGRLSEALKAVESEANRAQAAQTEAQQSHSTAEAFAAKTVMIATAANKLESHHQSVINAQHEHRVKCMTEVNRLSDARAQDLSMMQQLKAALHASSAQTLNAESKAEYFGHLAEECYQAVMTKDKVNEGLLLTTRRIDRQLVECEEHSAQVESELKMSCEYGSEVTRHAQRQAAEYQGMVQSLYRQTESASHEYQLAFAQAKNLQTQLQHTEEMLNSRDTPRDREADRAEITAELQARVNMHVANVQEVAENRVHDYEKAVELQAEQWCEARQSKHEK